MIPKGELTALNQLEADYMELACSELERLLMAKRLVQLPSEEGIWQFPRLKHSDRLPADTIENGHAIVELSI